jgi:hypothetical protein
MKFWPFIAALFFSSQFCISQPFSKGKPEVSVVCTAKQDELHPKHLELKFEIVNKSLHSITVPLDPICGFEKNDPDADIIVELQKMSSNNAFIDCQFPAYDPIIKQRKTVELRNQAIIGFFIPVSYHYQTGFPEGKYRIRAKYRISLRNAIPDIYSNWINFNTNSYCQFTEIEK